MAGKSADYWKNRFELLEKSQHNRGMECYSELESQYRKAEKEIEGQISSWYQRFADNNEISLTEARRMLNSKELAEFKWDVNDYIKYGEENAMNGQWMKQLENASARYHVSRLESLETQMQQQIETLFGNQLDSIDTAMKDIYTEGYYHTAYEIQKGVGVGWDFATLDTRTIDKVINKPWAADGKNFSERIWDNREKLVNELNQTLVQNIILGQDPQKAINAIADKLNVSKRSAGRLVMTEEAYFSSEAQKDCFNELDVEQYEIVATLDSHTSEICQEMDGKVFPMSQWEVGATAPPFHPWCRSTTVPAFGDEFDNIGTRAARDEETGKTYQVPGNCTYDKWEKAFVEGDKSVLQEITDNAKTNAPKEKSDALKAMIKGCKDDGIAYHEVQKLSENLTDEQIVAKLAGGDQTSGSCASLAMSYIGEINGYDIVDYRGGKSCDYFARSSRQILELAGIKGSVTMVKKPIEGTMELLKNLELNKKYFLGVGKHAAVVRRLATGVEYLELQAANLAEDGWQKFSGGEYGTMYNTLNKRFGCRQKPEKIKIGSGEYYTPEYSVVLMEADSFANNDEFAELMGYVNTAPGKQQKGISGGRK